MAMNVGSGSSSEDEVMIDINTTPLIDVMLVLIIMLIITIPVQLHSVNLNMPAGNPPPPTTPPVVVTIDVDFDGTVLWNGFEVVFALTPNYYWGLGMLVLTGMAQTICLTNITIMLLSRSSSDMRGRIMGLRSLAVAPLFLGSMLSGAAAEEIGAPLTTLVCALIGVAGALGVAPWVLGTRRIEGIEK